MSAATCDPLDDVFTTAPSRVPALVARARVAACAWGDLPFQQRADVLVRLRALVTQRAREIAEAISRDVGKPLIEARLFDLAPVVDTLDECIAHATDRLAGRYRAALLPPTPRAVVCVSARIGAPFEAMTAAVIALTAGNAVIVQSASSGTLVGMAIERLFDDTFMEFPGLAQVVHDARAIGAALTTSLDVDAVLFPGSSPVRGHDFELRCACLQGPYVCHRTEHGPPTE